MAKSVNACSLPGYLESQKDHAKFFETVKDLCVTYVLFPRRQAKGITVLSPSAEYLETIVKLANSANYDDVAKARQCVKALVLKVSVKSMKDWQSVAAGGVCPNWLNQNVPVSVSGSKVTVDGQEVELDSSFNDTSENRNLSVWHLKGSKGVGLTHKDAPVPSKSSSGKGKTGGYFGGGAIGEKGIRNQIAVMVENLASKQADWPQYFLAVAADLLKYCQEKNESLFSDTLCYAVCLDTVVDFYTLVDPHSMASTPLISDTVLEAWWGDANTRNILTNGSLAATDSSFKTQLNGPKEAMKGRLGTAANNARTKIDGSSDSLAAIRAVYQTISTKNELEGVEVYPKDCGFSKFLKDNSEWKALTDQLRFGIAFKTAALTQDQDKSSAQSVNEVAGFVEDYMVHKGKGVSSMVFGLFNCRVARLLTKNDEVHLFVNSDFFPLSFNETLSSEQQESIQNVLNQKDNGVAIDILNFSAFLTNSNMRVLSEIAAKERASLQATLGKMGYDLSLLSK